MTKSDKNQTRFIVGRGFLTPLYFMKTLLYCIPPPFFQILSKPPSFPVTSNPHSHCSFFGWICDTATFDVLVYLMILWIYTCRALVPEGTWCVFYATRHQVYRGLIDNVVFCWYSNLISHTQTHAHTKRHTIHSRASRLTLSY